MLYMHQYSSGVRTGLGGGGVTRSYTVLHMYMYTVHVYHLLQYCVHVFTCTVVASFPGSPPYRTCMTFDYTNGFGMEIPSVSLPHLWE